MEKHDTYKLFGRRKTRQVSVGGINIGGDAPISVQTMTKTKTDDVAGTVNQIKTAADAGVDIVRVTVNDKEAAAALLHFLKMVADSVLNKIE